MPNLDHRLAFLLLRVLVGYAGLVVACAQAAPGLDAVAAEPARVVRSAGPVQARRDNAPVVLKAATETLDIDGNGGIADALTDGLLVMRYLFGLRGSALVVGAVGPGPGRSPTEIESYLSGLTSGSTPVLNIDDNATTDALTDGLLVIRYLLGVRGPLLIQGVVGAGAARMTSGAIENYLATLTASTPQLTSYCQSGDQLDHIPWPPSGQARRNSNGFINQVYSVSFTVPATFNPPLNINHIGTASVIEMPGQPVTSREVTVSKSACDFHAGPGGYLADTLGSGNSSPQISFTVNNPTGYRQVGAQVNFQSGDTIYISVRNYNYNNGSPTPTCTGGGNCDIIFDFATPNRY